MSKWVRNGKWNKMEQNPGASAEEDFKPLSGQYSMQNLTNLKPFSFVIKNLTAPKSFEIGTVAK